MVEELCSMQSVLTASKSDVPALGNTIKTILVYLRLKLAEGLA